MPYKVVYITGVSGSGKTTIGQLLAAKTGYAFYDADDFHPQKNIEKMKEGQPLNDEDRWPWLNNIHNFVAKKIKSGNIILACSALKEIYKNRLSRGIEQHCSWVFLQGNYDTIQQRLQARIGHYMPESLLRSQFETLQPSSNAVQFDIELTPGIIVDQIILKLNE